LSAVIALVIIALGVGRTIGFNNASQWRDARLLIFPAIVVGVLPFVTGLKPSDGGTFVYLLIAYLLTGFMEEALMRGLVMWALQPLGPRKAIVISSILFGLIHIGNLLYRSPAIVFAQMIGALCDGIGQGALRIRSNTIWFPIAIHALHDLALRYSYLPTIPLAVVQDTLLLGYGLYLMRKMHNRNSTVQA